MDLKTVWRSYYGENLPRLLKIKKKYDPLDFFTFPHSLRSNHIGLTTA